MMTVHYSELNEDGENVSAYDVNLTLKGSDAGFLAGGLPLPRPELGSYSSSRVC